MAKLSFFIGKGGVGKSTVSSAYAIRCAQQNRKGRVLLVSTDPAHSLADILKIKMGQQLKVMPLPGRARLEVWQVNAVKLFGEFLDEYREDIVDVIDKGSIFSREDIEPLIDTTLPGMAEISGLLAIREALHSGKYSHIVVDTAPFGHTLRLFALPHAFVRFLNFLDLAASRDQVLAEHFGGRRRSATPPLLGEWRRMIQEIQNAVSQDADRILVTSPERFSLNESVRCASAMNSYTPPLGISSIVLNRAVVETGS